MKSLCAFALVALMAGCAQPAPSDASGTPTDSFDDLDLQATKTTGVIRGLVVDEAIRPVTGASVTIEGRSESTTTNGGGAFGFDGLAAGTYFLTIVMERYVPLQQGVEVEAGVNDPDPVRVLLNTIPGLAPYVETYQAELFIHLSSHSLGAISPTDDDTPILTFDVGAHSTIIQQELTWKPSSPTGEHVRLYGAALPIDWKVGNEIDRQSAIGGSPLTVRLNGTVDDRTADRFYVGVTAATQLASGPTDVDPAAGLVVNQAFQAFVHVFHNFVPSEDWRFVRDGPYPVPGY